MTTKPDPWAALTVPSGTPEEMLRRLERALAREQALREWLERQIEDQTRDLYLAAEQLKAQHDRLLLAEQTERARLARELAMAQHIQATLLPRELGVPGFDIAATMESCAEMGGDYYDIRPLPDGCWIGVGDVAGHGVAAGLVMLMLQCTIAALADDRGADPAAVLIRANRVLHDNIRRRMASDDHITATLLRFHDHGRVVFAGAHEEVVVLRARTGVCERIETQGTWLGIVPDITSATHNAQLQLRPGDTLLLYTDGLTEAAGAAGEQFGLDRVCAALERDPEGPAERMRDGLMASLRGFTRALVDDVTVLVLRYTGVPTRRSEGWPR